MSIFNKIIDFGTGKSYSYEKELKVYNDISQEIEKIFQVLSKYMTSEKINNFVFEINNEPFTLNSLKNYIIMQRNRLRKSELNRNELIELLKELNDYYILIENEIKNNLLLDKECIDLQECQLKINRLIYNNLICEPLKSYNTSNLKNRQWSQKELNDLKDKIFNQKVVIIEYLSKVNKKR